METTPSPIPPGGLQVTQSGADVQVKAQLRIWIAGIGGALVATAAHKLDLPILTTLWGQQGDQIAGIVAGSIMLAGMSTWQWLRVRLVNSRWWALAVHPDVPSDLVHPASKP